MTTAIRIRPGVGSDGHGRFNVIIRVDYSIGEPDLYESDWLDSEAEAEAAALKVGAFMREQMAKRGQSFLTGPVDRSQWVDLIGRVVGKPSGVK